MPYEGALWFLTALFLATILFDAIHRFFEKEAIIFIMCLLCVSIGHITCFFYIQLPWSLDAALVGVGLMYVGKIIQKKKELLELRWQVTIIVALIIGTLININDPVDMNGGTYSNIILFWLNAVGATIVGLNWSRYFCEKLPDNMISDFISWIGNNSIIFLCCNHIPILVVSKILIRIHWANTLLGLVLLILLISVIGQIFLKTPLRRIVGKM